MMSAPVADYDVAVSFAGEHRAYVEAVVDAAKALGLRVFYDRDMTNELWGQNFLTAFRKVYSSQARFFVPFISGEYLAKPYPRDEFSYAMLGAVERGDGYILPVLMDDSEVPPELLNPHIGYLRASDYTPERLAEQLRIKVGLAQAAGQEPHDVGQVVKEALQVRLPKVQPETFSKFQELQNVYEYLATSLRDAGGQLNKSGFPTSVRRTDERITLRVERSGSTVYALDIMFGRGLGHDDQLTFSFNGSSGYNAWLEAVYNIEAQRPAVKVFDLSLLSNFGGSDGVMSKEEFFQKLWARIVETVERQVR